ncbi:type II secretion system F family protein, partial [Candidatus Sumerlaeota bacterium]|nr:type II secretion system F family protein [Candidatus Sumerlaeota bacterium]
MGILRKLRELRRARFGAPGILDFHFLCSELQELLGAGFPVLTALQTTAENTQNLRLRSSLRQLIWKISKGEKWDDSLRSLRPGFPPFLTNMLILGNKTGSLTTVLFLLAQYYHT